MLRRLSRDARVGALFWFLFVVFLPFERRTRSSNVSTIISQNATKWKVHMSITRHRMEEELTLKLREHKMLEKENKNFSLSFNFTLLHAAHLLTLHNVHLHFWIFYAGSIHHPFTFIVTLSKSSLAWFMALLKNACCGCLLRDANENLRRSAQGGSGKFILHGIVLLMQGAIGSKYLIGIRGYARLYVCCRLSSFAFFYAA